MTQATVTLHLSDAARQRLADQAAAHGQDVSAYASNLVEQAVERAVAEPTPDEAVAPDRQPVAGDGMSDEELDEFFRGQIADVRRERREARERAS